LKKTKKPKTDGKNTEKNENSVLAEDDFQVYSFFAVNVKK